MFSLTLETKLIAQIFCCLDLEMRVKNSELSFQQIWIVPRSNYHQCEFSRATVRTEQLGISVPDREWKNFFLLKINKDYK